MGHSGTFKEEPGSSVISTVLIYIGQNNKRGFEMDIAKSFIAVSEFNPRNLSKYSVVSIEKQICSLTTSILTDKKPCFEFEMVPLRFCG